MARALAVAAPDNHNASGDTWRASDRLVGVETWPNPTMSPGASQSYATRTATASSRKRRIRAGVCGPGSGGMASAHSDASIRRAPLRGPGLRPCGRCGLPGTCDSASGALVCGGESTLVVALVRAGADYYSDEFAMLDEAGRVAKYLEPIQLRGPQGTEVLTLDSDAPQDPAPVGLVAVTVYTPGAKWSPRRLSHGSGRFGDDGTRSSRTRDEAGPDAVYTCAWRSPTRRSSRATAVRPMRPRAHC